MGFKEYFTTLTVHKGKSFYMNMCLCMIFHT